MPISQLQRNDRQGKFIDLSGQMSPTGREKLDAPLSPGASMVMRDQSFKQAISSMAKMGGGCDQLSPRSDGGGMAHCVCGLPMRPDQISCD